MKISYEMLEFGEQKKRENGVEKRKIREETATGKERGKGFFFFVRLNSTASGRKYYFRPRTVKFIIFGQKRSKPYIFDQTRSNCLFRPNMVGFIFSTEDGRIYIFDWKTIKKFKIQIAG